ncbi:MAG: NAD(P)/FAD-dependent oxidoreductase [Pseudomonadota bacterium]|nr:NAD(P)/FAD-dependent oxidoreductase [Pseudomonadota bacterium]
MATVTNETFSIPTAEDLGFDPIELRKKYAEEREKRLREEGTAQYQEVVGDLEQYSTDPYITEKVVRTPVKETVDVAIIGGGFGGLLAAVRLREIGVRNIRIIEKAGDFGGTWYWNRYPGAQCDIESYIYLPLLEEVNYVPKEKYSFRPEIFEHAQRIGKYFNLYEKTFFQTQVKVSNWDAGRGRWRIETDRGDLVKARFLIMSSGPLSRPKLPAIPGIANFKGHTFHTSRWDYDYTGGDSNGGLSGLFDKRVGIIGTGATAIQCVSHLGASAKELYVFQRTPSAIDERGNKPTDKIWADSLKPGWHAERNTNFASILSGIPQEVDLVNDRWTDLFKALSELMTSDQALSMEDMAVMAEIADYQKMNKLRDRVEQTVRDTDTVEALKPWYRQWCKRPVFNDEFLPTFNRENAHLIDTGGQGVERVTESSVIVDGVEYEVDCLIFATGFEVGTSYTQQAEFELVGKDGVTLTSYWKNGMRTYHGFHAHGFPNCFHMGLTQTGLAPCFTYMLDHQAQNVAYIIEKTQARNAKSVQASAESEAEWIKIVSQPTFMSEYQTHCTPGYYNNEGKKGGKGFLEGHYPEGPVQFYSMLKKWREEGDLKGLEFE